MIRRGITVIVLCLLTSGLDAASISLKPGGTSETVTYNFTGSGQRWFQVYGGDPSIASVAFDDPNPECPAMSKEPGTKAEFKFTGVASGTTEWTVYTFTDAPPYHDGHGDEKGYPDYGENANGSSGDWSEKETYTITVTPDGLAPKAGAFAVTPYLQNPAADAMTIIFFTTELGSATVTCGGMTTNTVGVWATALTNNVFQVGRGEEINRWNNSLYKHRVRFMGLEANRTYDYTVTLADGATYSNKFRTAPDRDTPIRFVSYADCETTSGHFKKYTSNLMRMKEHDPDLITTAGDLTARGGIQSHWDEFWMQNAGGNGIGYTDILGSVPMLTAIGNHDLFDNVAHPTSGYYHDAQGEFATEKFLSYFEFNSNNVPYTVRDGTNIPETRDMSQLFHREDYGPVTLIFLDTNNGKDCKDQVEDEKTSSDGIHDQDTNYCKYNNTNHEHGGMNRWKGARHPDFNPGSPQYDWLTNQLADAQQKSRFTFVFNHHCPYSVGGHNQSWTTGEDASALAVRVLTETMVRYGVDGWYCGHDELLEHSITNGYEILPDGSRRRHTLSIYDLGCSGDDDARGSSTMPPLGYWIGGINNYGDGKYGFLETDVTTNRNGKWTCTITPIQGSTGSPLAAQIVYVENPERGENENDLIYAQATNASHPIDGASQTKPTDWLAWERPPENPAEDEPVEISEITGVSAEDLTYNGEEQEPDLTVMAGELVVSSDSYEVGAWSPSAPKDAGTYTATVTAKGGAGVKGSKTVSVTIKKATLTVKPVNMSVQSGDAAPTYEWVCEGYVGGETKDTAAITGQPVLSCDYTTESAGDQTYEIRVTDVGTLSAANYTFVPSQEPATLTVTPAPVDPPPEDSPTVLLSVVAAPAVYTGKAITPTLTVKVGDTVISRRHYKTGQWIRTSETPVGSKVRQDVGEYETTVTSLDDSFTGEVPVTFTIISVQP